MPLAEGKRFINAAQQENASGNTAVCNIDIIFFYLWSYVCAMRCCSLLRSLLAQQSSGDSPVAALTNARIFSGSFLMPSSPATPACIHLQLDARPSQTPRSPSSQRADTYEASTEDLPLQADNQTLHICLDA